MSVFLTNASWKITSEATESLKRHNIPAIAGDTKIPVTTLFSATTLVKYAHPHEEHFARSVYDLCLANNVQTIFPMSDDVVVPLSKNKLLLSEACEVPIADYNNLLKAHDKYETYRLAKSLDVPVPETYVFENETDLETFSENATYPLVIKPRMGGGASRSVHIVHSKSDLLAYYSSFTSSKCAPLVQEYIPGSSEQMYMVNVLYSKESDMLAFFMAKKFREYPPRGGITTCGISIFEPILLDYAQKIFDQLSWYGVAEIEFKLDLRDGSFKLIEINPRFWQYLKLPISCGVDFPYYLYEAALGHQIEMLPKYKLNVKYINIIKDLPSSYHSFITSENKKNSIANIVASYRGEKVYSSKHLLQSLLWRI